MFSIVKLAGIGAAITVCLASGLAQSDVPAARASRQAAPCIDPTWTFKAETCPSKTWEIPVRVTSRPAARGSTVVKARAVLAFLAPAAPTR